MSLSSVVEIVVKLAHVQLSKRLKEGLDAFEDAVGRDAQHTSCSGSVVHDKGGAIYGESTVDEGGDLGVDGER